MNASADRSRMLQEQICTSRSARKPLAIRGGDSKRFLGRPVFAEVIDVREHRGIVSYDPAELVVTARAGTPLAEVEVALAEHGQMLACEPPHFGATATFGGMVAAGLSGPRRPWSGAVRDFVLGCRLIDGLGRHLRFGGEVIKNVAGYDLSRLLAGSYGCLALLTEISMKVLPVPRHCRTLRIAIDATEALDRLVAWAREPLPITGACHDGAALYVRLEGGRGSVDAAALRLGGATVDNTFWTDLREQRLPFFSGAQALWRLSLPPATAPLTLESVGIFDWGGAQRWTRSAAGAETIRRVAAAAGGHAIAYRGDTDEPFHPLPPALLALHRRLKAQFDPLHLFNPGRMYAAL